MMTPREVYNAVASHPSAKISTICDVKAFCMGYITCSKKSNHKIVDFDDLAKDYGSINKCDTPSSVDALALVLDESQLVLIEKKTWEQWFAHLTDYEKKDSNSAINKKIGGYQLDKKYEGTQIVINQIVKESNLFDNLPHSFVFLSELSENDAMIDLAGMLSSLAFTSSKIDYSIRKQIVGEMKKHVKSSGCGNSRYLNCMELDDYLDNPEKFNG